MSPNPSTESHTPGALEAVMADASAATPVSGGEPVPVTVSMPAVESAPATAEPTAMPSIGGVTEPTTVSTDMPAPGGGFGLGEHDLEHPVLPTTAATAANPNATAAIEGNAGSPTEPTSPPAPPAATTPPAAATPLSPEPMPAPAIAVNEAGAPTASQELGPTDKLVMNPTPAPEKPLVEPPQQASPEADKGAIPTPEEWIRNANEGLQALLKKESSGEKLDPEEIRAKDIFLAVLSADLRHVQ